jgi:hypothetical protein
MMNGAYSMHERDEKCIQNYSEDLKEISIIIPRNRWEDNIVT